MRYFTESEAQDDFVVLFPKISPPRFFIPLISVNFAETVAASDGKPQLRKFYILVQLGWEINLSKKVLIDNF